MKIVIPGGSGQVGRVLARYFHAKGDEVTVLSRTNRREPWLVVPWDGKRSIVGQQSSMGRMLSSILQVAV
jgi:nucleoside-diphosphate-sugar epimerase